MLEPIVVGIGIFTGAREFDPWPCVRKPQTGAGGGWSCFRAFCLNIWHQVQESLSPKGGWVPRFPGLFQWFVFKAFSLYLAQSNLSARGQSAGRAAAVPGTPGAEGRSWE